MTEDENKIWFNLINILFSKRKSYFDRYMVFFFGDHKKIRVFIGTKIFNLS